MDFSFDRFMEDARRYNALIKGVYDNGKNSRKAFMRWYKTIAQAFKAKWLQAYGHEYDRDAGWIGDAFAEELRESMFSDLYKDAYGPRPHLPLWYYVQAVGFPHSEDVSRTFCAKPVQEAMDMAKACRDRL